MGLRTSGGRKGGRTDSGESGKEEKVSDYLGVGVRSGINRHPP